MAIYILTRHHIFQHLDFGLSSLQKCEKYLLLQPSGLQYFCFSSLNGRRHTGNKRIFGVFGLVDNSRSLQTHSQSISKSPQLHTEICFQQACFCPVSPSSWSWLSGELSHRTAVTSAILFLLTVVFLPLSNQSDLSKHKFDWPCLPLIYYYKLLKSGLLRYNL